MPTYRVTDPSGRTVRLTGDSPPTEQELEQVFSSIRPTETIGTRKPFYPAELLKGTLGATRAVPIPAATAVGLISDLLNVGTAPLRTGFEAARLVGERRPINLREILISKLRGGEERLGETGEPSQLEQIVESQLGLGPFAFLPGTPQVARATGAVTTRGLESFLGGAGRVAGAPIRYAKSRLTGEAGIFGKRGLLGGAPAQQERLFTEQRQSVQSLFTQRQRAISEARQLQLDEAKARIVSQEQLFTEQQQSIQSLFAQRERALAEVRKLQLDEARARTSATVQSLGQREQQAVAQLTTRQEELNQGLRLTADRQVQVVRARFKTVAHETSTKYRTLWDQGMARAQETQVPSGELLDALKTSLAHRSEDIPFVLGELRLDSGRMIRGRDIAQMARRFRSQIPTAAKAGRQLYTGADDLADSVAEAGATVLRQNGVLEFDEASALWAQWAPLRNDIFRDFSPFLRSNRAIAKSARRLIQTAKSPDPGNVRYLEAIEKELGVPLLPEHRAALSQLDAVQKAQVAARIERQLLTEQAQLLESRGVADIERAFGMQEEVSQEALKQTMATFEKRQFESKFIGSRKLADIEQLFGTQEQARQEALKQATGILTKRQFELARNLAFRRGLAGATVGFAGMLVVWNIISNAVRVVIPQMQFENF